MPLSQIVIGFVRSQLYTGSLFKAHFSETTTKRRICWKYCSEIAKLTGKSSICFILALKYSSNPDKKKIMKP